MCTFFTCISDCPWIIYFFAIVNNFLIKYLKEENFLSAPSYSVSVHGHWPHALWKNIMEACGIGELFT
jgi:hypothetical protein